MGVIVFDVLNVDGDDAMGEDLLTLTVGSLTLLESSQSSSSSSSKSGNSSSDDDDVGIESGEVEDVDGVFLRRRFCAHSADEHDDADVRLSTPVDLITGESRVASWNELVFSASESTIARTDFMVMPIIF
jgi:hypothetical protein